MKKIIFSFLFLAVVLTGCARGEALYSSKLFGGRAKSISAEEAKAKALDFIKQNLVQPGTEISIGEVSEEGGLYKMTISLPGGQEVESYMTKDGKKFFPQGMEVTPPAETAGEEASASAPEVDLNSIPKAEKTKVELFVMSNCPYGTQIEKGMLPVLAALGSKVDFSLKFCDYAMHGEGEVKEQLNQVCIQREEPNKLIPYLSCFLKSGEGESCLSSVGVNKSKISVCVKEIDKKYKVSANLENRDTWKGSFPPFDVYKDDNVKYGVQGSPTLVINGEKVSTGRDAASLLKAVCAGFVKAPAECETELSSATPAPGFGDGTTAASANASCN